MAKISARGATEVARIQCQSASGTPYIYVMCSDGRVLSRITGEFGSPYKLRGKTRDGSTRTIQFLTMIAKNDGMTITN